MPLAQIREVEKSGVLSGLGPDLGGMDLGIGAGTGPLWHCAEVG